VVSGFRQAADLEVGNFMDLHKIQLQKKP